MTEIMCKAIISNSNCWTIGSYVETMQGGFIVDYDGSYKEVDPKTASFYTGFIDANKNPIFDGDILKGFKIMNGKVIDDMITVKIKEGIVYPIALWNNYNNSLENYKIIGNINDK